VSFSDAVRSGFDHYVKFDGRASRSAFWWWALFALLVYAVCAIIDVAIFETLILYWIAVLGLLLPGLSVAIRRLHDTDRSGWWLLIDLVPIIGPIVLLVFFLQGSDPGPNRFGPAPDSSGAVEAAVPPPEG
jgi:uncharacterized membrane protein YhaH (DUF805 family)